MQARIFKADKKQAEMADAKDMTETITQAAIEVVKALVKEIAETRAEAGIRPRRELVSARP